MRKLTNKKGQCVVAKEIPSFWRDAKCMQEKITKPDLLKRLKKLRESQDKRGALDSDHIKADDLLLSFINDADILFAFLDLRRWY